MASISYAKNPDFPRCLLDILTMSFQFTRRQGKRYEKLDPCKSTCTSSTTSFDSSSNACWNAVKSNQTPPNIMKLNIQRDAPLDSVPSPELHRKVILSAYVGMTFAALTTVFRLTLRLRYFGWDDALAGLAFISLIITAIVASSPILQSSRVALYYIFSITFDTTVWISRLSILFTIIRLGGYKKQLYTSAIFWVCEPQNGYNHWKEDIVPQCMLGKTVAITQLTTDAFADIVLVSVPLYLLRYLKSQDAKAQKYRLAVSFVVGGLTTFVSIVHAVYLLDGSKVSILVSNIELSVSVIIANFAVLAAAVYRIWVSIDPLSSLTRFSRGSRGNSGGSRSKARGGEDTKLSTIAYAHGVPTLETLPPFK
ncbi:hypothetical protein D9757_006737 [Collybiopsis confluens]|uniref:Integral membrane protein n=1 Tax=Collybiopsis confluens TaxID=2823264 RepID=A0A8H5M9D9_9AGAR|nr:hypothetical protein D9757_006737 [Collybiopsis confluens]